MPKHVPAWIMSPQAHRRLLEHMADVELRDLAAEIVRDLRVNGQLVDYGRGTEIVHETLTRTY